MHSDQVRERAEALFKKKQQQLQDGEQAMAEYQAERHGIIEKTARLRALRLARDAAQPQSGQGTAPARYLPAKTKTKKRVASPAA